MAVEANSIPFLKTPAQILYYYSEKVRPQLHAYRSLFNVEISAILHPIKS